MKKLLNHRSLRNRVARCVSVFVAAALVTGCVSINRLREAQDAFNQAAAAENAVRIDATPAEATASLTSISSGYASALLSLNKISSGDEQSLQSDGLWGTALTLKALCQWRLGQYSAALSNAEVAQEFATNQIYPRDQALLIALPGLIKTDQAYTKILGGAPFADVEALLVGPMGAVSDLQKARASVDKNHPVHVYLIQAQLAIYRNYTVAEDRLNHQATVPANSPARANAVSQLAELNDLLKKQKADGPSRQLVTYWAYLCGLGPPAP